MPTYEYRCKACNHEFELFQKVSDPAPATCPQCGAGPVQKLFRSVGIIFKGSGFHVNDYRKDAPKEESKSTEDAKKSDGAATDSPTKTEASPASEPAKTDATPASTPAASGGDAKPSGTANS